MYDINKKKMEISKFVRDASSVNKKLRNIDNLWIDYIALLPQSFDVLSIFYVRHTLTADLFPAVSPSKQDDSHHPQCSQSVHILYQQHCVISYRLFLYRVSPNLISAYQCTIAYLGHQVSLTLSALSSVGTPR